MLQELRTKIEAHKLVLAEEQQHLAEIKLRRDGLEERIARFKRVLTLYRHCIEKQSNAKHDIEVLATMMLQAVFDETFEFRLQPVYANDGTLKGLVPVVLECGVPKSLKRNGGGCCSILAFIVRLVFVLLSPDLAPVIFWDEFGTAIDKEKFPVFMEVVSQLQEKMPLQLIMVSHYGVGFNQIFEVSRPAKVSIVREKMAA